MNNAKILLLDIETAPAKAYSWGLYDQNIGINQVIEDGYVLCWAAKWLDSKTVMSDSIFDYRKDFKKNPMSDANIAKSIWKLINEADIIVTHNGDDFDIKWLNTIFLKNNLKPVSSFKSIDTLKEARKSFRFLSNKLDFIVKKLDLGSKIDTAGFGLWIDCMKGKWAAWDRMVTYCKNDVIILEKLYLELRPFIKNHPNLGLYDEGDELTCPNCGGHKLERRGFAYTMLSKYQRYQCTGCGKWTRGTQRLNNKRKVVANVL